jgi:hypothetical protein
MMGRGIAKREISRKVACSGPDDGNAFFLSIYLIILAALGPGIHSASKRNEYQKQKSAASA